MSHLEEYFWRRVEKSHGCWLWTAYRDSKGYGFAVPGRGQKQLAHRVSWVLHFGQIPDGLLVLHKCDNPPCVRPDHLFLGTHADNAADMVAKDRQASGDRNGASVHRDRLPVGEARSNSKLTAAFVVSAIGELSPKVSRSR